MADDRSGTSLTWATHPNTALRMRLAGYLGRGWTIESLEPESAVVSKPKAWTKPARILINPFLALFNLGRQDRLDRRRLFLSAAGEVLETRI